MQRPHLAEADCSHIFLVTQKETQKSRNICRNSAVSLPMDDRDKNKATGRQAICSLTISGTARPCSDPEQKADVPARMKTQRPHLAPITQDPKVEVIVVRLNSWQLLDGVEKARLQKMD